jgi:competence protein ComEC
MTVTDVHVLNVGAGSCTVVEHPSGHVTMVDVNDGGDQRSYETERSDKPLTDPIAWCKTNAPSGLFRFILSHPDADHMAGLRRMLGDDAFVITNFWDLQHTRTRTEGDCRTEAAWHDWALYVAMREDLDLDGVTWPKRIYPMRGDSSDFWNQDSIEVLSPTQELVASANKADVYNDASYVLRFRHGTSSVLLASDIEEPAWRDIIDAGVPLRSNVLIASHHGRKSGFSADAMDLIRPEVVIVSTAKLPAEHDGISLYKSRCDRVLSTRVDGDTSISMYDDGTLAVYDSENKALAVFNDA